MDDLSDVDTLDTEYGFHSNASMCILDDNVPAPSRLLCNPRSFSDVERHLNMMGY